MTRVSPKRSVAGSPEAYTYLEALEKIIKKKNNLKKKPGSTELRHMAVLQASKQRLCKDIFRVCGSHMMWELVELSPFEKMDFSDIDQNKEETGCSKNSVTAESAEVNASLLSSLPGTRCSGEDLLNNNVTQGITLDKTLPKSYGSSDGCDICDSSRCFDTSGHRLIHGSFHSNPMLTDSTENSAQDEDDDPLQLNNFFRQLKQVSVER